MKKWMILSAVFVLMGPAFSTHSSFAITHSKAELIWNWQQWQFKLDNIENNKVAQIQVLKIVRDEKIRQLSEELKQVGDHTLEIEKIAKKFAEVMKEYSFGENKANEDALQASAKLQQEFIQKYKE